MTAPSSDGWAILRVAGEIDLARMQELEDLIAANCNGNCPDTVVDLSDVGFMDSTGVAWLIRSRQLFHDRGRRLVLVVPTSLDRIFELSGLTETFAVHRSLEDATATP